MFVKRSGISILQKLLILFVDSPEIISMNVLMKGIAKRHIVTMNKPKPRNIKRLLDESIQDDPKVVPVKA